MVKIVHARIDENGNIMGGKKGDQTGKEVVKQDFYDADWHTVYRPKEVAIAKQMAKGAEAIAKNDSFGYSQSDRYTGYDESRKVNFDFGKVTTPCAFDCSSMVMTLIRSAGIDIKRELFTWNMDAPIIATGCFDKIPYTKGMALKTGDIVLKTGHVVIVVESDAYDIWVGECYGVQFAPVYAQASPTGDRCTWPTLATGNLFEVIGESGDYYHIRIATTHYGYIRKQFVLRKTTAKTGTVTSSVYVRQNAGASYKAIGVLNAKQTVEICDTKKAANGADWYYIKFMDGYGFSSARYIKVD